MNRQKIKLFLKKHRPSIEKIRIKNDELQAFGKIPGTNTEGWYFLAYAQEIEIKGLNCLL